MANPTDLDKLADTFVKNMIERLYKTRVRKGISQSELSRRTGVPQKTISRMEHGLTVPTFATLYKLAEGMDYSLKFELERKDESRCSNRNNH